MDGEIEQMLLDYYQGKGPSKSSKRKNFNPKLWGPPAWTFLDTVVKGYPSVAGQHDRKIMANFLMGLGNALPCHKCRLNYMAFIKEYPPIHNVSSRRALKRWFDTYKKEEKRNKKY